ncbi:hypothetical protein [Thioalbus denitrificans]|uniref:hypothetical protein n=1 Tax=Thioalbus denitrificans TaxID=547122 RepID=UPI0011C01A03|nr:hypothetical protein [Thioalbus denitrificans]
MKTKTLSIATLALTLISGAALAENRNELDTDILYGGAAVQASSGMALPGHGVARNEIDTDVLYGTGQLSSSPARPAGERVVERNEIDTDVLYGV